MRTATYELLPDEGLNFGSIPGFDRVWVGEEMLDAKRRELEVVEEAWILYRR